MDKQKILVNRSDQILSGTAVLAGNAKFEVITFEDGLEAIKKARTWQPDFILINIMTLGLDGYEVCRIIKTNPLTKHIPVVLLAGRNVDIDKRMGQQAGAADYLLSPVNPLKLIECINRILVRGDRKTES